VVSNTSSAVILVSFIPRPLAFRLFCFAKRILASFALQSMDELR
jgi:hypothetical protein